jgi:hypothetical protein
MGRVYRGLRTPDGAEVTVDDRKVPFRYDLRNHSPTGFEWGYGGRGPAQLALALLADVLGDDATAELLYQKFKWECIAIIKADAWTMVEADVRDWVRRQGVALRN